MTIAFIIIFGLIALLSKTYYKTATVVCGVSIVNLLAYEWLGTIDPVSVFMILASFDMIVALFLLYVYGDGKRDLMAALLILASFAHCFIGMYATIDSYIHYDLYTRSIAIIDLLQLVLMWGCINVRDILRMVSKFKHTSQDYLSSNFSYWRRYFNVYLNSNDKEKD